MVFPQAFENTMHNVLGDGYAAFAAAADKEPVVSVRLNDKIAVAVPSACEPVEHCSSGYYLPRRPLFTMDPLFHAGAYYVQEASSMYLEEIFRKYVSSKSVILDLCAAPGGKSTHAANLMPEGSLLVSNEIMPDRAAILLENVQKWGCPNAVVCNNAPRDFAFLKGVFDILICDMPCSGEGMFRKEPQALKQWTPALVASCAAKQREILADVWDCLKEDGLLIYSTCTFNPYENEDNIAWAAQELGAEILQSRHFYFHTDRGEGFFIAALRKTSAVDGNWRAKAKFKPAKENDGGFFKLLKQQKDYVCANFATALWAWPQEYANLLSDMVARLRVLSAGVGICDLTHGKPQPNAAFALSKALDATKVQCYKADLQTALRYLKGETLVTQECARGPVLICYGNLPIGWANNIGARANNLYPKQWRIKMEIRDSEPFFSEQELHREFRT